MPTTRTRLGRADALADRLVDAYLRLLRRLLIAVAAGVCALVALYVALLVLDLLSWGSQLEDYQPLMEDIPIDPTAHRTAGNRA